MSAIKRWSVVGLILGSCAALFGCGAGGGDAPSEMEEGPVGELSIELTVVPAAVRCIAIDVTRTPGSTPQRKTFSLMANAPSANLALGRFTLGPAQVTGFAWDVDCADPTFATALPSWQAPALSTNITLGATSKVKLNFFANDPATVDANFIKNLAELSMGQYETYARFQDNTVWQWGAPSGVLNNVSTVAKPFSLANVAKVVVGFNYACAMLTTGTVSCWGSNTMGQLGPGVAIGASTSTPVNVPLPGGSTAIDIAAGDAHTCVVANFGAVICWGDDTFGQLGLDPMTLPAATKFSATPVFAFNAGGSARVFAGGDSTCNWNGTLSCWGRNDSGQLGNGNTFSFYAPTFLPYRGVVDLAMGDTHACALHADGTVGCWGGNTSGQVGDNTTVNKLTEFKVFQANGPATNIAVGANHSCMLSSPSGPSASDRVLTCWGDNLYGQLGDGTALNRVSPTPRFAGVIGLFAHAGNSTCIVLQGGLQVQCTGYNAQGQLGDGTRNTRFTFSNVTF